MDIIKTQESLKLPGSILAAGEGFEPSQTESESVVLPLHNPATDVDYYNRIYVIVKTFYAIKSDLILWLLPFSRQLTY